MSKKSDRPENVLRRYDAWEPRTDQYDYQWKLRLLQSHWRAEQELPVKYDGGKVRGAELCMPEEWYRRRTLLLVLALSA